MPVMPERPLLAAGAHDQADRDAGYQAVKWVHPDEER
jgi:hypothetical protein